MSRRTSTAVALASVALLAGSGYGASQAAAATPAPAVAAHASSRATLATTISIRGYAFHVLATVSPGRTVKVVNHDGTTHSVTRNGGGFSVIVPAHSSRTFRAPTQAGAYKFHRMFHSTMHATLTVR